MANADRPRGAECKGDPIRVNKYIAGAAIEPGDFVHMEADGKVDPAAAAEAILGVAISSANDTEQVLVADHPDQLYIVQADEADVAAQTELNLNADIVATASSSAFQISRHELDSSTINTTATLQLKILDIEEREDNAYGTNVDCVVKINNHQLAGGTGTAGL